MNPDFSLAVIGRLRWEPLGFLPLLLSAFTISYILINKNPRPNMIRPQPKPMNQLKMIEFLRRKFKVM
jgi:hypothetical protein